MKLFTHYRITLSLMFLAVGAFSPNLHADWGSLHGSNRSSSGPSSSPRQPQVNHESQPVVRAPEPRQEIRPVEQPRTVNSSQQTPAGVDRFRETPPIAAQASVAEADRRRMDIDADRRQSFFWSDFHAGMRINRLPDGYRRIGIRGHPYFYFEGVYYDDGPSGYVIVAPPLGAIIPELPPGAESVVIGDTIYYYVAGAFYIQQANGYVVVAAPLGVTVSELPPDAVPVNINGTVYYVADGAYYLPVMQNGVTAYLTVQQP
jgi:hypothetical protein